MKPLGVFPLARLVQAGDLAGLVADLLDLFSNFLGFGLDLTGHIGGNVANLLRPLFDAFPGFLGGVLDGFARLLRGVLDGVASLAGGGLGLFDSLLNFGLLFATHGRQRQASADGVARLLSPIHQTGNSKIIPQ